MKWWELFWHPSDWSCTWCGAYNNWQSTHCWKCGAAKG
jgi:hypothetical protein